MRDQISQYQPDWACFHFYNDTQCDSDLDWTDGCINQKIRQPRHLPDAIDSPDRDWGKSNSR